MFTGTSALNVAHCQDLECEVPVIRTVDTEGGHVGAHSSIAMDAAGNPVVSYYDLTKGDLKLLHCNDPYCDPGGDSIVRVDTVPDVGFDTSLALDARGNPVISYYDRTFKDLKVVHCGNPNCSANNVITRPDTVGNVGKHTSLALDTSGNPVVSYVGDGLKVLHCATPTCQ